MGVLWIILGGTLVVFALAGIWLGGWFFGLALLTKILLTVLVLILVTLVLVTVRIVKMMRARRIENALVAQGAAHLAQASADRQGELQALQTEMQNAIASLKRSRIGTKTGAAALYSLPWYVIVGPPGAGKTTAIRHSGLTFPLDHAAGYRGVGGTRNCDWWFTNDGIILDTAGRYTQGSQDKDQPEWLSFLDLLRKYRSKKPLNGLIVAIAVPELTGSDPAQIEQTAKQVRARLDEVTTRLKLLIPVYVVFTKVDMVAGFIESWDDLKKSERGQIWGTTFPVDPKGEPHKSFRGEFDGLVSALHGRAVRRMATERNVATRDTILRFPGEVAALKEKLGQFIDIVFQKNAFQETPLLRGVYLTSGTQTVRPMARVVSAMSAAHGGARPATGGFQFPPMPGGPGAPFPGFNALANRGPAPQPQAPAATEAKSFFLTDLFFKVMFPDANLGGLNENERRRQMLLRGSIASLAFLAACCLVLPAGCTFFRNRELVHTTAEIGDALRTQNWDEASTPAAGDRLGKAEARLRQLDQWREDIPVQLRWGMYTGNELFGSLRDAYAAAVWRGVIARTRGDLEDRLKATESSPVRSSENFNRDFDFLKLYLMLGDPQHMEPEWAAPRIVRQWEQLSHAHAEGEGELLVPHVQYVCELLKRGELKPWKTDPKLVTRARSILAQVPQVDRLYESLVRDANTEIAPIRRETVFYGSVGPFVKSRNSVKIPGAYTKQGWLRVKTLLGSEQAKLAAERWVLGEDESQVGQAVGKLRDLYFERFKNAWRDFIADIEIADPGNAEYALAELNAMSEPEWPYLRLIRTLNENVTLEMDDADAGLLQKATDKAKELLDAGAPKKRNVSPVERAFKPLLKFGVPVDNGKDEPPATGLSQWIALVSKLVGVLTDYRDGAASSDPTKTSEVFQEAFRTTSSLLSEQDGFTRPLLSPLLMQPITLGWSNVVKDSGVAAEATWEVSVWAKWHDKLEGKYPFAESRTDATLDDVIHFFGSGEGSLWAFYDESLKATLERNGNTFTPSRRFRSSIGYTTPFLDTCLKRGAAISEVLFIPKAPEPSVVFDVNLHSVSSTVSEVTFEVDGASRTYKNEPEQWLRVTWPGKAHGARLRVRGANGLDEELNRPGDFGLFHLLDAGDIAAGKAGGRADGQPTVVATWELRAAKSATVKLDIRPARQEHPFAPGYFKGYNCPRIITAGK